MALKLIPVLVLSASFCAYSQTPWKRHTIDDRFVGADGIRVADANADGLPDLTTGWEEAGCVRVYLHPGHAKARHPWPAVTVGTVASPEDAVFADLDGDGALDVVSSCEGKNRTVFIHWAPADAKKLLAEAAWRTDAIAATAGREMWMYALPLQIDGRHGVDLFVGSKGDHGSVSWLEAPADARKVDDWKLHRLRPSGWIMSLIAHDVDGDADADVLLSDRKGPQSGVFWLENPGPAAAARGDAWREHRVGVAGTEVMFIDVADLFGTGRDGIVASAKPQQFHYLERPDGAVAWREASLGFRGLMGSAKAVRAGDIDRDGRLDLVVTCEDADGAKSGVSWFKRDRDQRAIWRPWDISGTNGEKFDRIELLDLDGDGDLDVVTCEEKDKLGVIWYENPR